MSMGTVALLLALLAIVVGGIVLVKSWRGWRERRLVTCPENEKPAAVRVDATRAVVGIMTGEPDLRLSECSRWPEKQGCGQECLRQIELGPGACLVRTLVARWYEDKSCVVCGKPIRDISWAQHWPGLRAPDGHLAFWPDVAPETLLEVFKTHAPVCWDCTVVQKLATEHPDVVTVRPPHDQLYG